MKHEGCGGIYRPDGMCYASNPPQYGHICDRCFDRKAFDSVKAISGGHDFKGFSWGLFFGCLGTCALWLLVTK